MKKRGIIKSIISYILALMLAVVFALYLNANVGWFMLIALILAPVASVFFAWLTSKTVSVSCQISGGMLSKGDDCQVLISVKNKSVFPTTPIELSVLNGDGVRCADKKILCTVLPMHQQRVIINYKARICGPSEIGLENVKVTDYLGIVTFKPKKINYSALKNTFYVIPDIADVSLNDDRILKVMQASNCADDSEDTVESTVTSYGGFPGYDNREYVPGDPLKRINWKQSAKRDKLLVRLDDEVASKSVNLVLDSVFKGYQINVSDMQMLTQYGNYAEDEILPKLAEDAVENALGIMNVLVRSNYTVNFFVKQDEGFNIYSLEDEKDIEELRIFLAKYRFDGQQYGNRFPLSDINQKGVFVVSTPNTCNEVYDALEEYADMSKVSVFSVVEEAVNHQEERKNNSLKQYGRKAVETVAKDKLGKIAGRLIVSFMLVFVLSITVFSIFDISPISYWTVIQLVVCVLILALCEFSKKNKLLGTVIITVLTIGLLFTFMNITRTGEGYTKWFMSGGELIENTSVYLMSLVLVFTVFFSMVIYYYTQIRYRTSVLLLTSIIPFVIYVKVMKDIEIKYVMAVVMLNVLVFLVNNRKNKDRGKRIAGFKSGVFSVGLYLLVFAMIALAVPKDDETKYYYKFEERFLGGNTSLELSDEYMTNGEYSGNADNYNQLNNRKLYEIYELGMDNLLYLKRQNFDYYDFSIDRWYGDESYSSYEYESEQWTENQLKLNIEKLADAMVLAEELQPGFLEKYGLEKLKDQDIIQNQKEMYIVAQNFASDFLLLPTMTVDVELWDSVEAEATPHGAFGNPAGAYDPDFEYRVRFYDQFAIKDSWIALGGADFDTESSIEMLKELKQIMESAKQEKYIDVAEAFIADAEYAMEYNEACEGNNDDIPESVRELAQELTADCKYDWEKAVALQYYFRQAGFVYDLEYDAPDDSVEYFLFESKTGTCTDYASAYILMARSVGLTVRYTEGFVPQEEDGVAYSGGYIVRTTNSHAYPEVYIQNLGFVVYEPTMAAVYVDRQNQMGSVTFVMTLGFRILLILAIVSSALAAVLFIIKILIPVAKEKNFMSKVKKAEPGSTVVMIYKRILEKESDKYIENGPANTPYEYAERFEKVTGYDISPLTYMVEKVIYRCIEADETEKKQAIEIYSRAKQAVKESKKNHRKNRKINRQKSVDNR